MPAAKLAGVPVRIASIRDTGAHLTMVQRKIQRVICKFATCVLANSDAVRDWLISEGFNPRKIRVIRNGIVVFPPADRTVGLDSLKRFKEDVREVQQGYECGMKLTGYDDIKVDDVIEAYRIQKVQRTLS